MSSDSSTTAELSNKSLKNNQLFSISQILASDEKKEEPVVENGKSVSDEGEKSWLDGKMEEEDCLRSEDWPKMLPSHVTNGFPWLAHPLVQSLAASQGKYHLNNFEKCFRFNSFLIGNFSIRPISYL